jgi:hypothetical protein
MSEQRFNDCVNMPEVRRTDQTEIEFFGAARFLDAARRSWRIPVVREQLDVGHCSIGCFHPARSHRQVNAANVSVSRPNEK